MPLAECGCSDRARIIEGEPPVDARRGALYVPATGAWAETGWGLYDYADRSLSSAACNGPVAPEAASTGAVAAGAGEIFVYGGLLAPDLKGFLLGSFARLWSNASQASGARLLFHTRGPLEPLLAMTPIASVLAALGIAPENCVAFDAPTRIERLVLPAPAIEPGHLAFAALARLASTVAIRLAGRVDAADLGRSPVHISSALEPEPVLENERAFDRALEEAGVVVLHPAEVSFATLVTRVRSAPLLSGTASVHGAGAGCLASLFRDAGPRLLLCTGAQQPVDSTLIDLACRHDTLCVRPSGVAADAQAYLRVMRRMLSLNGLGGALPGGEKRTDLGPLGRCTSIDSDADASSVVGHNLTGTARLRIAGPQFPWWQLEWDGVREVEEVVVYGPVSGEDRPAELTLLGSFDGKDWTKLGERSDPVPIGGIDGKPHRFSAGSEPWRVRLLRLQSGTGILALDGIDILAPAAGSDGSVDADLRALP